MTWIDTHAHLNDPAYELNLAEVLDRASAAGVSRIVVIGTDPASSRRAVEAAQADPRLYAAVGLHPTALNDLPAGAWNEIESLAGEDRVVAVGETGLDRLRYEVSMETQREYFHRHLELAQRIGKPVVIHCRGAEGDVIEAVAKHAPPFGTRPVGVMHAFTGDSESARRCLALGLMISFAGMLTFKKNDALRATAAGLPLDRIVVETDSPYLSPEPFRGRTNEPSRVVHTGARLAEALGRPVEAVAKATTANARKLFSLDES
jgi:TatD DNase family protein